MLPPSRQRIGNAALRFETQRNSSDYVAIPPRPKTILASCSRSSRPRQRRPAAGLDDCSARRSLESGPGRKNGRSSRTEKYGAGEYCRTLWGDPFRAAPQRGAASRAARINWLQARRRAMLIRQRSDICQPSPNRRNQTSALMQTNSACSILSRENLPSPSLQQRRNGHARSAWLGTGRHQQSCRPKTQRAI